MGDRLSVHQRGSGPSHVDMAARTNGGLELAKCSFDLVHHALVPPVPPLSSLLYISHDLDFCDGTNVDIKGATRDVNETRTKSPDFPQRLLPDSA